MKITLCGSIKFADKIVANYHKLEELGHEPKMHELMFDLADGSAKDVLEAIAKDLGEFIELEAQKHYNDPKAGKEYLYSILNELNAEVGEENLRGYPFQILEKQGYNF